MLPKSAIFEFLTDLRHNNSKDWMDENRDRYHQARDRWIQEVGQILEALTEFDEGFGLLEPKSTLSRINNNRRFHPDRPLYKDYFTCDPSLDAMQLSVLHISIGPGTSFVGAGMHHPSSEHLRLFHQAIDIHGDEFREIIQQPEIKAFYGELSTSDRDLKTAPRGYAKDHPHIDILRRKSLTLMRTMTDEEVCADDFPEWIARAYELLMPFNAYLAEAIQKESV
ncbi:MAG: DUF2461 domain-containing protein [Bacteroidota bacterium]